MKFVTFQSDIGPRAGVLNSAGKIVDLAASGDLPSCTLAYIRDPAKLAAAKQIVETATALPKSPALLAPVQSPGKIICIGLNYADHARETGAEIPPEPVVFNKFITTLCGPETVVELPAVSTEVDYEAELVVVIGKSGRHITEADAMQYVFGYMAGNDVSARDWQKGKPAKQWLLGKSFDNFAPTGPWLVTADEIADPHSLAISLKLNGEVMQQSKTDQLIFNIPKLISYVSDVCTLHAGDLIFTGTPAGVGMARKPPRLLKNGDVTEVEIEGLGVLRNSFVAAKA